MRIEGKIMKMWMKKERNRESVEQVDGNRG